MSSGLSGSKRLLLMEAVNGGGVSRGGVITGSVHVNWCAGGCRVGKLSRSGSGGIIAVTDCSCVGVSCRGRCCSIGDLAGSPCVKCDR